MYLASPRLNVFCLFIISQYPGSQTCYCFYFKIHRQNSNLSSEWIYSILVWCLSFMCMFFKIRLAYYTSAVGCKKFITTILARDSFWWWNVPATSIDDIFRKLEIYSFVRLVSMLIFSMTIAINAMHYASIPIEKLH